MDLSVPPMLPEDRKHLDIPPMPAPRTRLQKDGIVWELICISVHKEVLTLPKLTLEFVAVNSVNPVNPV